MNVSTILQAMRADCIQPGACGLWYVKKTVFNQKSSDYSRYLESKRLGVFVPVGTYTHLFRWTEAGSMQEEGEVVMVDFPSELKKHLQFILKARGRVLVTGLGLGCVVRGLLQNPAVESIDLVERDENVIKLTGHSVENARVRLHVMDARERLPSGEWDYAWHDLWSDPDKDEPHLQVTHFKLMDQLIKRVGKQGAWALPRRFTTRIPEFQI